jgi:hypothetical protein
MPGETVAKFPDNDPQNSGEFAAKPHNKKGRGAPLFSAV